MAIEVENNDFILTGFEDEWGNCEMLFFLSFFNCSRQNEVL